MFCRKVEQSPTKVSWFSTIGNPGSIPTVTIDGNSGAYPGFFLPMRNVIIQNMIFQNLTARGGNGGDGGGAGGGAVVTTSFSNGIDGNLELLAMAAAVVVEVNTTYMIPTVMLMLNLNPIIL